MNFLKIIKWTRIFYLFSKYPFKGIYTRQVSLGHWHVYLEGTEEKQDRLHAGAASSDIGPQESMANQHFVAPVRGAGHTVRKQVVQTPANGSARRRNEGGPK